MTTNTAAKTTISAQIPIATVEQLRSLAREADRSLSAELRQAVAAHLEHAKEQ